MTTASRPRILLLPMATRIIRQPKPILLSRLAVPPPGATSPPKATETPLTEAAAIVAAEVIERVEALALAEVSEEDGIEAAEEVVEVM